MKVRTKLTLFSILLIVAVVAAAAVMIFSFARENALTHAFDSALNDYDRAWTTLSASDSSEITGTELIDLSYVKYLFGSLPGSWEYALQTEYGTVSNNTGIDAYRFLSRSETEVVAETQTKYGYTQANGASYIVIGREIHLLEDTYFLSLVRDITSVSESIGRLALQCLLFSAGLLVIAAFCMFFVVRRTLRPLSVLQKGVKHVASGRYDDYIRIKGKNEFSELAGDYNDMARAVAEKIAEIEKTSEDRKLLLSALSHEMRTPVAAICANAHTLTHVRMSEELKEELLGFVSDESRRLERLSAKLMQLISLDVNEELLFEEIRAKEFAADIRHILEPIAAEHGIRVLLDASDGCYKADRDLMTTLVTNLFDNARKAGADTVTIRFDENEISVCDNGCGIPQDKIEEITKPFYKLDKSRSSEGFGLGLALVRRIADAHHAELVIDSEFSQGTKITLAFESLQLHDDLPHLKALD